MSDAPQPVGKYKRVLLENLGEALIGPQGYGLHPQQ